MKYIKANDMRSMFLEFFESKNHKILPSASLVPHGDASLLLTGAGMVPFKPYFLGHEVPEYNRVTTCQKCIRTPDIENVGKTDRHGTFFEMLGNFSFGDYFKAEVIPWAWEFVTEYMEIPKDKIWVTVYLDDDEAHDIWADQVGIPKERIVRLGKEDNFWEIGVGYPCGPCSEMHYDRGPEFGCGKPDCKPGCDCERYMEFWNLVFIQYRKLEDGYEPLAAKSVDTGMGFERVVALMQGVKSIFEIDLIRPIINEVAGLAKTEYGKNPKHDVSLRVITDHVRSVTFLVADGVLPSNEGRGYILRRLLRRAARHGRLLGIESYFLLDVVDTVIAQMQVSYPELVEKRAYIDKVISLEEKRFHETLDQGMGILQEIIDSQKAQGNTVIPGVDVFKLYDTYGFPVELTEEIAEEQGLAIDQASVQEEMNKQRERARSARSNLSYVDQQAELYDSLRAQISAQFVGYETTEHTSTVAAIIKDDQFVDIVSAGDEAIIILPETPFYAESGGQVADTGTITGKNGQLAVTSVGHPTEDLITHIGKVASGSVKVGDQVLASVYRLDRNDTQRHHSATHLLHKALREVLGDHVQQAGSLVDPQRLRFDFTHFEAVSASELLLVEQKVNEAILANYPVDVKIMSLAEAKEAGAVALFGEKYGSQVRVVKMGDYTTELCGGTHVKATGEIGFIRILSEGSVAAGVRRLEAVAGKAALKWTDEREQKLLTVCARLHTNPDKVVEQLDKVLDGQQALEQELSKYKQSATGDLVKQLSNTAVKINEVNLVVAEIENASDHEELRSIGDQLRDNLAPAVVFLGAKNEDKVLLLGMASKEIAGKKVHIGNTIKEVAKICGGGGGGRPDMAQAGGRNPEKLTEALQQAQEILTKQLED